jgi:hypothetical protein
MQSGLCIWPVDHIAFPAGYRNRLGALLTWWLGFSRDVRRGRTFMPSHQGPDAGAAAPELAPDNLAALPQGRTGMTPAPAGPRAAGG